MLAIGYVIAVLVAGNAVINGFFRVPPEQIEDRGVVRMDPGGKAAATDLWGRLGITRAVVEAGDPQTLEPRFPRTR